MAIPLKRVRSGNFDVSLWQNEKEMTDGSVIGFKSITLRKTWRDHQDTPREQSLNLRAQDLERVKILLTKVQEFLLLEEEDGKEGTTY